MRPVNVEGDLSYRSEMKRISLGALEACGWNLECWGKVSISSYQVDGEEETEQKDSWARSLEVLSSL